MYHSKLYHMQNSNMKGSVNLWFQHNIKASGLDNSKQKVKADKCQSHPVNHVCLFVRLCEILRPNQQLRACRARQLPINTVPGQA